MVAAFNISDSFRRYDFYQPGTTPLVIGLILAVILAFVFLAAANAYPKLQKLLSR